VSFFHKVSALFFHKKYLPRLSLSCYTQLVIVFVLLGLALSAIILMQEGKSQGLGALSGTTDSYWQKNRGRSVEGNLEKFTKFAAFAFFAVALVLDIIW